MREEEVLALAREMVRGVELEEPIRGWLAYRRERRLPAWTERTWRMQLARAALDPAGWLEALEESIAQGWQGIFPRDPGGSSARPGQARGKRDPTRARDLEAFLFGDEEPHG